MAALTPRCTGRPRHGVQTRARAIQSLHFPRMAADEPINLDPSESPDDKPVGSGVSSSPLPASLRPGQFPRTSEVEPLPLEPEPRKPLPVGIPVGGSAGSASGYSVKDLVCFPHFGASMRCPVP